LGSSATAGEASNVTTLRGSIWAAQARFGDAAALARAKAVFASGQGSAADQRTALNIVGDAADAATFDALLARVRASQDPQEKSRLLRAMARARDPQLSARMVEIALSPDAPAGSSPSLISTAGSQNPDAVWTALGPHLGKGGLAMDDLDAWLVVTGVASFSFDAARIADVQHYGEAMIPADARRPVVSAVSYIKLNRRVRAKALPDIDRWVATSAS
jgi:hypothetical protein